MAKWAQAVATVSSEGSSTSTLENALRHPLICKIQRSVELVGLVLTHALVAQRMLLGEAFKDGTMDSSRLLRSFELVFNKSYFLFT